MINLLLQKRLVRVLHRMSRRCAAASTIRNGRLTKAELEEIAVVMSLAAMRIEEAME